MSEPEEVEGAHKIAPGGGTREGARAYLIGGVAAFGLTIASFAAASTGWIYGPSVPILLAVLAIAQMGVHLIFFLHLSSAPEEYNTILAVVFGIFVVGLVVFGSLIIMADLNYQMMPMDELMKMQP